MFHQNSPSPLSLSIYLSIYISICKLIKLIVVRLTWRGENTHTHTHTQTHTHIYIAMSFARENALRGYIVKRNLTCLNSEFSFSQSGCHTKVKDPCLPYYLLIVGGRIIGFIPFSKVLAFCEMQKASSRIWTRVTVSISNDVNHYTTSASLSLYIYIYIYIYIHIYL